MTEHILRDHPVESLPIIYYESHINLPYAELMGTDRHLGLIGIAREHKFKLSNMNGNDGHPDEETQTILTAHTQTYAEMEFRVKNLLEILRASGFKILRYKIEAAPIDSRKSDVWGFLSEGDRRDQAIREMRT